MKKLLFGLAAIVAFVVLALVAVVLFVDINRFKPQIAGFVRDTYQRELTIDGELGWSIWPSLAITLPKTTLSDRAGAAPSNGAPAVAIEGARVSVALVPLLSGSVQADKVVLSGLEARIVRRADGSTSIDDLLGGGSAPADPAPSGGGATTLPELDLGGVEVRNARIVYVDEAAGNQVTVQALDLDVGRIAPGAPTPLSLSARVATTAPKLEATVRLGTALEPNLAAKAVRAARTTLVVDGRLDGAPLKQELEAQGLVADAQAVVVDRIVSRSNIEQGARAIAAQLQFPLRVGIASGLIELPAIEGSVDVRDPSLPAPPGAIPFTGALKIDSKKERVDANLKADAPGTVLTARVDLTGFATPRIGFDVKADEIDLDRYLGTASPGTPGAGTTPTAGAPAAADTAVDLAFLEGLNLAGTAAIGRLKAQGLTVTDIDIGVKAAGGRLDVAPLAAQLYGGRLSGKAGAQARGNRLTAAADLDGVNIGPLLADLTQDELLEGRGRVRLDIATAGASVEAMKRALSGTASVALEDGAIVGINLAEKIRDAKSLLQGASAQTVKADQTQKTDFSALSASFVIRDGVARNQDLDGKSPLFRLGGGGLINIAASTLDYTVRASVVGTTRGQGGRELEELRGVTIPVMLTGPFDTLDWTIDWRAVAEELLKTRAGEKLEAELKARQAELKAREDEAKARLQARQQELEQKAADKLKEAEQKLGERLGRQLEGLLR